MRKNSGVLILITLVSFLLCDTQVFAKPKKPRLRPPPLPTPTATIQGRVIDSSTHQGISGARVTARSLGRGYYSATTDSNGYYTIQNIKVWRWGSLYRVSAKANGYRVITKRLRVRPGGIYTVNFFLHFYKPSVSTIRGRVIDRDTGRGIADARVMAWSWRWWKWRGRWRYEVYTNSEGYYEIKELRIHRWGTYYRLKASKKGYRHEHRFLFVRPNRTYTVSFALIPVLPPVVIKITSPPDGIEIKEDTLDVEVYYRICGWQRYKWFDGWYKIGRGGPRFWWFRRTIDLKLDGEVVGTFRIPFWKREGTHTFAVSGYSAGGHELQAFLYLDRWKKILLAKSNTVHFTYISDVTPPVISNLTPPDSSIINNSQPEVSAIVTDAESGIDRGSIQLALDGQLVTHSYNSSTGKVSYTPQAALSEGFHNVVLSVRDNMGNESHQKWSFTTDARGPVISDLTPPDGVTVEDSKPVISVNYSDNFSGIDASSVIIKVDGTNVTPSANVTSGGVNYTPPINLANGEHKVEVSVSDLAGNLSRAIWSFTTYVKNLIDGGGGTVTSPDEKARVIVPEGAVSEPVLLTVDVEDTSQLQDAVLPDTALLSAVDFGPDGINFNKPVEIILPLDKAEIPGTSIKLGIYNPDRGIFEDTGITAPVNTDNTSVSFEVTHFTIYGALKSLISTGVPIGGGVQIPTPDLFTGAFTHTIPITVPPGRKDMQPELQLRYRSSNPNSWVGMGWTLNPGYITRSTRKGPPAYNNEDIFIYVTSSSATELVNLLDNLYQAKVESSFTKFFKEEDSWKAIQKDGTIILFGTTSESRIISPDGTFSWMVTRITDPNGNYITFDYTKDRGKAYLSQIQYTGNDSTGFTPEHVINFILEDREDIISSYISGTEVSIAKRLKEIEVKVLDKLAWRYIFEYKYSEDTNRSLLKSITQYGSDGITSFPPKEFTYQKAGD